jgi:uncharacterized protein (DUF2141 family)
MSVIRFRLLLLHAAIILLLVVPMSLLSLHAGARVEASVAPRLSYAPTSVKVTVSIEPDAQNRTAIVEVESAQVFQSSEVPLDGNRAARVHEITYADLPPGQYIVRVRVVDSAGSTSIASARFEVLSRQ